MGRDRRVGVIVVCLCSREGENGGESVGCARGTKRRECVTESQRGA